MNEYNLNTSKYGTHKLIADELGKNMTVLDIGCNKGYLKILADDSNSFWGIDFFLDNLQIAKKNGYKIVYKIDLNNFEKFRSKKKFDILIFADILEHLVYPEKVLTFFVNNNLKDNGKVIISLPNILNISMRMNLLFGRFDYTEEGILDKTHLHFYTSKAAKKLINFSGLKIIKEKFSSNRFGFLFRKFAFLRNLLGYNLIYICIKNENIH
jgi:2-polyprenyl-3-methyl-5-hydroxy-6-metoxy-1,4-benzoquinol methylase